MTSFKKLTTNFQLLCLLFVSNSILGQNYTHNYIDLGAENDLNGQYKVAFHYDQFGFLWMGSQYGIDRYDGNEVLNIEGFDKVNDKNLISQIVETPDSLIWVMTSELSITDENKARRFANNVYWIQPIQGKVKTEKEVFPNGSLFPISDLVSFGYKGDRVHFATKDGSIYSYSKSFHLVGKIDKYELPVYRWIINGKGNLVLIEENMIREIDMAGNLINSQKVDQATFGLIDLHPNGGYQISALTPKGIAAFHFNEDFEIQESIYNHNLILPYISVRKDNTFLKVKSNQAIICDAQGDEIVNFNSIKSKGRKDINWDVQNVFQPKNEDFAIIQTSNSPLLFHNFRSPFNNFLEDGEPLNSTRGIAAFPDGTILVSSGSSLYKIKDGKRVEVTNLEIPTGPGRFDFYSNNYYDEKENLIWIVTGGSVLKYNLATNQLKKYYEVDRQHSYKKIIRHRQSDELLITCDKGLLQLNLKTELIEQKFIGSKNHPINNFSIDHLEEIGDELLIIANQETFIWNPLKNEVVSLKKIPEELKDINSLEYYIASKQSIWFATSGAGIVNWNLADNTVKFFKKKDGLSSNVAYCILPDKEGNLWIPTTYGLNKLNLVTNEIRLFTTEDGLPHNEFNRLSFHKGINGNLFFGGLNGITKINPDDLNLLETKNPATFITEMSIQSTRDSSTRNIAFNNFEKVELKTYEMLTLKFCSPNVRNFKPIKYQYKFVGEFSNWQEHSSSSLIFSNVNPGTHLLKIRGRGIHKDWSNQEATLEIFVPTPFFQSKLFFALLLISIAGIGIAYSKWRIYNLQQIRKKLQAEVLKRTHSIEKSKELIQSQANELKQLDKLKSQFFTNISHELRTPLTLIKVPLDELKKFENKDPDFYKLLLTADSGSESLKRSIEKILSLSELDTEKMKLSNSITSLRQIVQGIIDPIKSSFRHLNREFKIDIESDAQKRILLDIRKLKEIIENLIFNAVKFSNPGSLITLRLKCENETFEFICSDSGIGIIDNDRDKIFHKYFQGKNKNIPAQGGLGLGLPLSREYAKVMGGDLILTKSDQNGSVFKLTVPYKKLESGTALETSLDSIALPDEPIIENSLPLEKKDQKKNTILIVEDNNMMNLMLSNILKRNYNVLTARNGLLALEVIEKNPDIELILTDWMMPDMDGPSLIDSIRNDPKTKDLPIIILSARASQSDKNALLRTGIEDYIYKPFDPDELAIRIRNLFARSKVSKKQRVEFDSEQVVFESSHSADQQWIIDLEKNTRDCIDQGNFSVAELARAMLLSERQFSRKLKSLMGITPGNFLKEFKLVKARHLLEEKKFKTVSEVCINVGFNTPDHFRKIFFERFGRLPSSYIQS